MKKKFIMFAIGFFAIATITTIVSCNKDCDYDNFYGLDINDNTPLTRNTAFEISPPQNDTARNVPVMKDECMLYAIVKIAVNNKLKFQAPSAKTGEWAERTVGNGYSAATAYNDVKSIATQNTWPVCDVNGNPIAGEKKQSYMGGAMPLSIGAAVGKQTGILKGGIIHFDSYDQVISYISSSQWKGEHSNGSYLISNDSAKHVGICNGVSKKGNLRYSDSDGANNYTKKKNGSDAWTVIY